MSMGASQMPEDLVAMLGRQVSRAPHAPCLTFEDQRIDFATLQAHSEHVANALRAGGLSPGDRVAILAPASPLFFDMLFGCAKAGMILVPINWRLSAREIADVLADAEPSLVFVAAAFASKLPADLPAPILQTENAALWRQAAPAMGMAPAGDPDAPVLILYTSGTTGRAKGAMLSQVNLCYLERTAREMQGFSAASRNLVAMPLFHIGGIGYALLGLSQGGETVLTQETDPGALIALIVRHAITHAFFVPTVIQRLLDYIDREKIQAPHVDHLIYGAAPMGPALLRRAMHAFGSRFHHAYGLTETAGTVVTLGPEDHDPDGPFAARLQACGRPMPWVELTLIDPATGRRADIGDVGEIRLRSGAIMRGYWRNPAETSANITPEGWLCTGDAAVLDSDGYVYLRDRYKDMIVSGGENIYPVEIDHVLQHHPAISEVAVVGVPHPTWGETPRAYVVLRPGCTAAAEDLIAFARERLAHYKCPTSIVFTDALPRTASGKIMKRDLRALT